MISLNSILIVLLSILLFLVFHSYLLYPLIIRILASLKEDKYTGREYMPEISILCSAYNEEKVIAGRINNILNQNYDLDKIEFIVGSDCSNDRTNDIINSLAKKYSWLKVRLYDTRGGKATVINHLVREAKYDILVFTDANTDFDKNALKLLVQKFQDPTVGGVSGRLILNEPSAGQFESNEEKRYWDYEISTKVSEGKLGVLIGANGGIFAIRKRHFREIPVQKAVTDDFFVSLCVLSDNSCFVYSYDAVAVEEIGKSVELEIKRKIRFAATNFQTALFFPDLLFNKKPLVSFAFWSHKIIRWFIPFLLITAFISNILLASYSSVFTLLVFLQILFYFCALIGYILSYRKIRITVFSVPFFFVASNYALLIGFFRFISGKHSVIWQSTPR